MVGSLDDLLRGIYPSDMFKNYPNIFSSSPLFPTKESKEMSENKNYKVQLIRILQVTESYVFEDIVACSEQHAKELAMKRSQDVDDDSWAHEDEEEQERYPNDTSEGEVTPAACEQCTETVEEEVPSDPMRLAYVAEGDYEDRGNLVCPYHKGNENRSKEIVLKQSESDFICQAVLKDKMGRSLKGCECRTSSSLNPVWIDCAEAHKTENPDVEKVQGPWWKSK